MTGRVGGRRSVSFPLATRDDVPPGHPCSPIIVYGNLRNDQRLVGDLLKTLGLHENELHGNLQVILSALRRMAAGVELLLAVEEGDAPRARVNGAGGGA